MKIAINSKTSGKYSKQMLNNRAHLVTNMTTIVGDSVMNRGFYPLDEVKASFEQLHFLPAPNGHPKVGNELVSAFHPLAVNAFNFGGLVRNPRMDGAKVINEFWLDIDVANQSDDGKELIRRIESGESVGVSTGLTVNKGEALDDSHDWVAKDFNYDHVAILLNEKAAGAHVGTQLETNAMVVNCAEPEPEIVIEDINESMIEKIANKVKDSIAANSVEVHDFYSKVKALVSDVFNADLYYCYVMASFPLDNYSILEIESKASNIAKMYRVDYTIDSNDNFLLSGEPFEVVKKVEFVPVSGDASNNLSPMEDVMSKENAPEPVTNSGDKLTVENAVKLLESKGMVINSKEESDKLAGLLANADKFQAIIDREEVELSQARADLVANSDLTDEDVSEMSASMVGKLSASLSPKQNYQANAAASPLRVVNSDASDDDYEDSYTKIAEGGE